jgi:hypothetical protein
MNEVQGGFPTGVDGRVHGIYSHNPSSGRLSMHDPNLQQIPRGNQSKYAKMVKECFVAPEGSLFWERDFSAIEAVLVGYFSGSRDYTRFAKLGVHAYLASHIARRPADLTWSDDDLRRYFGLLKKEEPIIYDTAKRVVHGSNYMMTPRKMSFDAPKFFPTIKSAAALQGLYFELFPAIRQWHQSLCERVDAARVRSTEGLDGAQPTPWALGVAHVRNPFGYTHRFYNVLDWEKRAGEWWSSYGEDAKRLISFLPQSTAACIIKSAGRRLWRDYPETGSTMRLWIHDSIVGECGEAQVAMCLEQSQRVMEAPIEELPLDPEWGMGSHLSIGTEAKTGATWASMK